MRTAYQNIKGAAAAAGDRDFLTNPSSPPTIIAQQSCTPAAPLRPAEAGLVRPSPVVHRRQAQRSGPRDLRSHEPPISTPQLLLVPVLAHGDPSPPPLLLFQAHPRTRDRDSVHGKKIISSAWGGRKRVPRAPKWGCPGVVFPGFSWRGGGNGADASTPRAEALLRGE